MGIKQQVGKAGVRASGALLPKLAGKAPGLSHTFVREALNRAIHGVGRVPGAISVAESQVREHRGNRDKAIKSLIEHHAAYAGAQGFVTNLGGLMTMPVTVPANIGGLALVQCRLIAAIAHVRGYDLTDPKVRNAVLACLLGQEKVERLVKDHTLPAPPMALATAPVHDPGLDQLIAAEVASELLTRVGGRRLLTTAGRRVPVVGGAVGASADALATWQVGRYASRELRPRARR